jgi:hypothetical protein
MRNALAERSGRSEELLAELQSQATDNTAFLIAQIDESEDIRVRHLAALALEASASPEMEILLLGRMAVGRQTGFSRYRCLSRVIGKTGAGQSFAYLDSAVNSSDTEERSAALETLAWMASSNKDESVREMAKGRFDGARRRGESIRDPEICAMTNLELAHELDNDISNPRLDLVYHEIGDRFMLNLWRLEDAGAQARVEAAVKSVVQKMYSKDSVEKADAVHDIHRLGQVCADDLLDCLSSDDMSVLDDVIKALVFLRNREIVERIVERARTCEDPQPLQIYIHTLGRMKDRVSSIIMDRESLGDEESNQLAVEIIVPFLEGMQRDNSDKSIQKVVEAALKRLTESKEIGPKKQEGRARRIL